MNKINVSIGSVFHYLTVESRSQCTQYSEKRIGWKCKCKCGRYITTTTHYLRSGRVRSCGCIRGKSTVTHGESYRLGSKGSKEFITWSGMIDRCCHKYNKSYKNYGGRGIKVCKRWRNSFSNFLNDMGRAPSQTHTIDRIDVNGDYYPSNCRWATPKQQGRNRRRNHLITVDDETKCLIEWSELSGVSESLIRKRLKLGWTAKDAIWSKPYGKQLLSSIQGT